MTWKPPPSFAPPASAGSNTNNTADDAKELYPTVGHSSQTNRRSGSSMLSASPPPRLLSPVEVTGSFVAATTSFNTSFHTRNPSKSPKRSPGRSSKETAAAAASASSSSWAPTFVVGGTIFANENVVSTPTNADGDDNNDDDAALANNDDDAAFEPSTFVPPPPPVDSEKPTPDQSMTSCQQNHQPLQQSSLTMSSCSSTTTNNSLSLSSNQKFNMDNGHEMMVATTLMQSRLEWNQRMIAKAFQPYKAMICSMDGDNFPSPEELLMDNANEDDTVTSSLLEGGGADDGFFFISRNDFGDKMKSMDYCNDRDNEDDSSHSSDGCSLVDIRTLMLNNPDLTEREVAAFFEGMRLYRFKVNSLQSQLDALKAMQHQRRMASLVYLHRPTATTILNRSATMTPTYTSVASCTASASTRNKNPKASMLEPTNVSAATRMLSPPLPRSAAANAPATSSTAKDDTATSPPAFKSLRAMSIARVRHQVDAMEDNDGHDSNQKTNMATSNFDGNDTEDRIDNTRNLAGKKKDIQRLLKELEEAEKYQRRLEKQLRQAGVVIAEDIPYDFAKKKVATIAQRMAEIGGSGNEDPALREEYFKLEQEMEKYTAALQLTEEWAEEQERMERQWEESVSAANEEALKKIRRHMPVNVRNMSEADLFSQPTPNGKFLPKSIAKKFKRTNCLQLLRIDPLDIMRMHPSTLENMRVTGLTLTERRALYLHLKDIGPRWKSMQSDKLTERKWNWFNMMKSNFKENVDAWQRHVDRHGPPGDHPYATSDHPEEGCPLIGKQCPLKADKVIDYDGDFGFPEGAEYFKTEVKKSEVDNVLKAKQEAIDAAREKKESERSEALKRHYKGKILQVSLANGSCEAMDESMDKMELAQEKWIRQRLSNRTGEEKGGNAKTELTAFNDALNEVKLALLSFAERSGMQMSGKRDSKADKPDFRSMVEISLCEEVIETSEYFFLGIEERMEEIRIKDGRMKSNIQLLRQLIGELHQRNIESIDKLLEREERPPRSRKMRNRDSIALEVQKELEQSKTEEGGASETKSSPCVQFGEESRGNLMIALKGRGGNDGGRGGLMDALKARGRGRGDLGGRGGLMAAIAARGAAN